MHNNSVGELMYDVGDRVQIVDRWNKFCGEAPGGRMDHWLGQVMTVRHVPRDPDGSYRTVEDQEEYDHSGWYWNRHCIAGLAADDANQHLPSLDNGAEAEMVRLF